jgi:hypothetical protein
VWSTVLHNDIYRISLIAVFVVPMVFVLLYPPYDKPEYSKVEPAAGIDIRRTVLMIDGNSARMHTEFPHEAHKQRLGGENSCARCHHMSMPDDHSTPCSRCHTNMYRPSKIFDHDYHTHAIASDMQLAGLHPENRSCNRCHPANYAKTHDNAIACLECHTDDMNMDKESDKLGYMFADSYMDAMHKNCIGCHEKQQATLDKDISSCATCHQNQNIDPAEMGKFTMK